MCTWNLVSHIKRATQTLGFREWGADEDMRIYVGRTDRWLGRKNCIKRGFVVCTAHRMYGSQMEEDQMGRAAQVAHTECWHGNKMERDHLEDAVLDERTILKWIWKKWVGKTWLALEYGQMARFCEHGYETAYITSLAAELLTSDEGIYSRKLVG